MEEKAGKAILEEPVKFKVKVWGLKIRLSIKPLYVGTIVTISKSLSRVKLDLEGIREMSNAFENIEANGKILCKMIAIAILNSKLKIKLFSRPLTNFLYWHLNSAEINALSSVVVSQSGITDFIASIVSLKGLSLLSPKRGTSPTGTGETIAPGASSEA